MTGYGKTSFFDEQIEIQMEIKTVNAKNFDLRIYNHKELFFLENEITEIISKTIKRGKIELRIMFRDLQIPHISIDTSRLHAFYQILIELKNTLHLKDEVSINTLINLPDVVVVKKIDYDNKQFKTIFFNCLHEILTKHQVMASKEGENLKIFFQNSLASVKNCICEIKHTLPQHKETLKSKLIKEVRQILHHEITLEQEKRILLEIALYLERCDITEEITRVESHFSMIEQYLGDDMPEIGKTINFILQELQREVNTISAKYNTTNTFLYILKMKEEIEKCREQIQNVE